MKDIFEKTANHLREKWGSVRPCPMCGGQQWFIDSKVMGLVNLDDNGNINLASVFPVVPVSCSKCHNTVLISGIFSGIVPSQPEPEKKNV